jgi:RNAse (barnase) inhibitor barstar
MIPMAKRLLDAKESGVYQLVRTPEEVERAADEARLAVFRIDIGDVRDKKDFLARVARALSFPNWFGANWDALNDCLRDLDWLPMKNGYVLILEQGEFFAARHSQEFDDAKAVLGAAAEYWKAEGRPFCVFIATAQAWDAGLPYWP